MKYLKSFKIYEGRYDSISNRISSEIFRKWKSDFQNGNSESLYEESYETSDIIVDVVASISFIEGIKKLIIDGGVDSENDYLEITFSIDPLLLPNFWEEISMNLKDVVRHEIEHLTHGEGYNLILSKQYPDDKVIRDMIKTKYLPISNYFTLPKEIDANLQGMYFRAKKERKPLKIIIDNYLNSQDITPDEKEWILSKWRKRISALNLSNF